MTNLISAASSGPIATGAPANARPYLQSLQIAAAERTAGSVNYYLTHFVHAILAALATGSRISAYLKVFHLLSRLIYLMEKTVSKTAKQSSMINMVTVSSKILTGVMGLTVRQISGFFVPRPCPVPAYNLLSFENKCIACK